MSASLSDPVIPLRHVRPLTGRFHWPAVVTLASTRDADVLPLAQLAEDLDRAGHRTRLVRDALSPATVRVRRDPRIAGAEHYRLLIEPDGITVLSGTDAGAYYGLQTLRERVRSGGADLAAVRIDDAPDFARRGLYLDCSRGKVPTVDTLKQLIEKLAHWKMNELQLYIENVFAFRRHPAISRGYDPFTVDDLLDVQAHAARHHVTFVPSLASFGHMERVLGLPAYRHLAERPGTHGLPGGTTLCPLDPGSIRLMAELYEEFLPIFTADDFNACGDEPWELGKGRSARAAARVGVGKVYAGFIRKLHAQSDRHGKRLNLWADIVLQHPEMLSELPRDMIMLNWDYQAQGQRIPRSREIVAAGFPLVVCPGTGSWQVHGTRMENATGNVIRFAAEGRRQKALGLLMTDWGDWGHRQPLGVSLRAYAHAAAHAWHGRGVEESTFTARFCRGMLMRDEVELPESIERLGRMAGLVGNDGGLYHGLVEPADPQANFYPKLSPLSPVRPGREWSARIDKLSIDGVRRVEAELRDLCVPVPQRQDDGLGAVLLDDLALAARLDYVSAKRALCVRQLHAGDPVPARAWRALTTDLRRLRMDFERNWLALNRPSRLKDNLWLLDCVIAEGAHQASPRRNPSACEPV